MLICKNFNNWLKSFFQLCFDKHLITYGIADYKSHETVSVSVKMAMLKFCIQNRITQKRHMTYGHQPQMNNWNKTSRHKLLIPCKQFLCYVWHNYRGFTSTLLSFMEDGGLRGPSTPMFRCGPDHATCRTL